MSGDSRDGATSPALAFTVAGSGEVIRVAGFALVVAGYTGRDEASVRKHIEELAAIGVAAPESVPAFYPMDAALATQDAEIVVEGGYTSGEVEPVLIRHSGRLFLGVGSDHTDRDLERVSVAASKAMCPKPLSATVVELPSLNGSAASFEWDSVTAESSVDGAVYQRGTLEALRVPTDVLALRDAIRPEDASLVMFCGTLPLLDGEFIAGRDWQMSLTMPDRTAIRHAYRVTVKPAS